MSKKYVKVFRCSEFGNNYCNNRINNIIEQEGAEGHTFIRIESDIGNIRFMDSNNKERIMTEYLIHLIFEINE